MKKPVLVIMAAGMGSRYGGLKQIEPVDAHGHIIMDFSIYDACEAGFEEAVFIIRKENETLFRKVIGDRVSGKMRVHYVYQELSDLPQGFSVPEGREKPWGTGHAVYAARDVINGPFAVINADDYYGKKAFHLAYDYLTNHTDDDIYRYMMTGYVLKNTVTEHGYVSRGICETDGNGYLKGLTERTKIIRTDGGCAYFDEVSDAYVPVDPESIVSMNMWGFTESFIQELKKGFAEFLQNQMQKNPSGGEYYLPFAVNELLQAGKASVKVLPSPDKWYGVTYKEDKEMVSAALARMEEEGKYPAAF